MKKSNLEKEKSALEKLILERNQQISQLQEKIDDYEEATIRAWDSFKTIPSSES
jgi:hypothetical protein